MSALDHRLISQRYFFPRRDALSRTRWVETPDARLACFHVDNGHPLTVVHFHGNGEVCADWAPELTPVFDSYGANTFLAEYRGYGQSSGVPQLRAMLDDTSAIFDALGCSPDEVIVFGRSVGSIYAIEFANRYNPAGLILESGIADVRERILMRASAMELGVSQDHLDAEFAEHFDHAAKLAERTRPTLVLHTRHDALVDASHGERLASYPASNTRLVMFARGGHNDILAMNRDTYFEEVATMLRMAANGDEYADPSDLHPPRSGPGFTAPMIVPEELRDRSGPGDTLETKPLGSRGSDD